MQEAQGCEVGLSEKEDEWKTKAETPDRGVCACVCVCVCVRVLSHVWLFATSCLSMGFSRQEYWSGLPFPYLIWVITGKSRVLELKQKGGRGAKEEHVESQSI